jgi:hypothetical protein
LNIKFDKEEDLGKKKTGLTAMTTNRMTKKYTGLTGITAPTKKQSFFNSTTHRFGETDTLEKMMTGPHFSKEPIENLALNEHLNEQGFEFTQRDRRLATEESAHQGNASHRVRESMVFKSKRKL